MGRMEEESMRDNRGEREGSKVSGWGNELRLPN